MLGIDAVLVEQPIIQRGVEMNKSTGDCAGADANFHHRLTGLGEVGIGMSHAIGSASDCEKKSDKKICASTITDRFHIETPD